MSVDVAFGTVRLTYEDISVPGRIPLVWDRRYSTALLGKPPTPVGYGWTCRYYATLTYRESQFEFVTPQGGVEYFPGSFTNFLEKKLLRNYGAFLELFSQGRRAIIQSWDIETGEVWRYCFNISIPGETWKLSSIEDITGQGIEITWDASGRLESVQQKLEQRALRFAYDRADRIIKVFLRSANSESRPLMEYRYNAHHHQIEARNAAEHADRFEYSAQGQITREIARDGGIFHYRYDHAGRCVLRTGLGHYNERRLHYIDAIHATEVADSYGRKHVYQYLPSGQIISETDPSGGKRTTEYDQYGRVIRYVDATGAATYHEFDEQGNRSCIINALDERKTVAYNNFHQPLITTDASGKSWYFTYDNHNRLTSTKDPLDNQWQFLYDQGGSLAEVVNPKGHRKTIHSHDGVVESIRDWNGNETSFTFDAFGRIIERRDEIGGITRYRYDPLGNPVQAKLPDGTVLTATYDQAGNLTRFIDGNGYMTRWRYGPCMRLIERTDPAGGTIRYLWGSERGLLKGVVNERGEIYTYRWDEAGRIVSETAFDGTERHFVYDSEGYTSEYTNSNGERIKIHRDALHRITTQILPDGNAITFTYDTIGNLASAISRDSIVQFERDSMGRITREVQGDHWVATAYDKLGNVIHTETSLGHSVSYKRDGNGFLTKASAINDISIEFKRNAFGQEVLRCMQGGFRLEQRYDTSGRLHQQRLYNTANASSDLEATATAPPSRLCRRYHYDRNGALTCIHDSESGTIDYTYDPAQRLLTARRDQGVSEKFEYDLTGNTTRMLAEGSICEDARLAYDVGNRLRNKSKILYEYDIGGRLARMFEDAAAPDSSWTFSWDALDQLKSVTSPSGEVYTYQYDALGRRIRKASASSSTDFIWDRDLCIHQVSSDEKCMSWIYDTHRFTPFALVRDGQLYSIISDHLGTPFELDDSQGNPVWKSSKLSWGGCDGKEHLTSKNIDFPISFPGFWIDSETGLNYARFRYYDPQTGRFISPDPLRLSGSLNVYAYARNPINWLDPYGLSDSDVKPADYRSPLSVTPGTTRVEVTKISENTGLPYQHVAHYDDQGRLIGQTHYTDHGRPQQHTVPHHHRRDPETGERLKSPPGSEPGAGTRAWPGSHPDEAEHLAQKPPPSSGCSGAG